MRIEIEAILFDFDGTLAKLTIDFSKLKEDIKKLCRSYTVYDFDPSLPVLEIVEAVSDYLRDTDPFRADSFFKEAHSLIKDRELESARNGELFYFTRPLLRNLREWGLKIGIITRNCADAVRIVFPDILDYCDIFLPRDRVRRVKPNPEHLLVALEKLKVSPQKALTVGDHLIDLKAGLMAGTWTAGVNSDKSKREEFLFQGSHWVASNCKDLFEELLRAGVIKISKDL